MSKSVPPRCRHSGFTLIELSIVLVIIGLIAGGVLVGKEMIRVAQLRATVSQIERYNTAVRVFQGKYNCLPGDCTIQHADAFGLPHGVPTAWPPGIPMEYNENGLINDAFPPSQNIDYESSSVFSQLAFAGLIEGKYSSIGDGSGSGGGADACFAGYTPIAYPVLKNKPDTGIIAVAFNGHNYWRTGITRSQNGVCSGAIYSERYSFTPSDALYITTKIGNGLANTIANGTIQVVGIQPYGSADGLNAATDGSGNPIYGAAGASNAVCFDNSTNAFNTSYYGYICNLLIPAQF